MSTTTASELAPPDQKRASRVGRVLRDQLRQGTSRREISLALTLGTVLGVLPTLWGTSLLCMLAAQRLRLNQALVQLANYLAYPLQILLLLPYLKMGERLFGTNLLPREAAMLEGLLKSAPFDLLRQYGQANLQALAVWGISAPLLVAGFYPVSLGVVSWMEKVRKKAGQGG